jgi:hypothetical protein
MCANHPQTPTALRCNRCGKPVCIRCIVRTPVGYRCRECVRGQQQVFESVVGSDYVVAVVIAAPLAALIGWPVTSLQFFSIFLAPLVGGGIAELVRLAVRRRRGRYLNWAAAIAFVVGCLPLFVLPIIGALLGLLSGSGETAMQLAALLVVELGLKMLWILVYAVLGASALYARLRGISF